jgi:hypothetical protein
MPALAFVPADQDAMTAPPRVALYARALAALRSSIPVPATACSLASAGLRPDVEAIAGRLASSACAAARMWAGRSAIASHSPSASRSSRRRGTSSRPNRSIFSRLTAICTVCSPGSESSPSSITRSAACATNPESHARRWPPSKPSLDATQRRYHDENLAFSSQQRRCHDLDLELLQLTQAAEAAEARRGQIAAELADLAEQQRAGQAQGDALAR